MNVKGHQINQLRTRECFLAKFAASLRSICFEIDSVALYAH